jgi:hypothetical protein
VCVGSEVREMFSTLGFWFWSKKDFCRVDMEMVGSVSVLKVLNATRRGWPMTLSKAGHHVTMGPPGQAIFDCVSRAIRQAVTTKQIQLKDCKACAVSIEDDSSRHNHWPSASASYPLGRLGPRLIQSLV